MKPIKVCLDSNPFAWFFIWDKKINKKCDDDNSDSF